MPRFNLDEYIPVQERINEFWKDHPEGRIVTSLESDPHDFKTCRYKATIYSSSTPDPREPVATGYAFEVAGGNSANATSHEENCETSAIGRALANMGYATSHKTRPSREEMEKVQRMADEQGFAKPEPQTRSIPLQQPRPVPLNPTARPAAVGEGHRGIYLVDREGAEFEVPSVSRQHGKSTMADLLDYLVANRFNVPSGRKGDAIKELENTYKVTIKSGRGVNQYGDPEVFPGELYDVAHYFITADEQAAE